MRISLGKPLTEKPSPRFDESTSSEVVGKWAYAVAASIWDTDAAGNADRLAKARKIVREALKTRGVDFPSTPWNTLRRRALGLADVDAKHVRGYLVRLIVDFIEEAVAPSRRTRRLAEARALAVAKKQQHRDPNKLQASQRALIVSDELSRARSEKSKERINGRRLFSLALSLIGQFWEETGEVIDADGLRDLLEYHDEAKSLLWHVPDPELTVSKAISEWTVEAWIGRKTLGRIGGQVSRRRTVTFSDYSKFREQHPDVTKIQESESLGVSLSTVSRYRREFRLKHDGIEGCQ